MDSENVSVEFSKESGLITGLAKGGVNYLQCGVKPCLDRPFTGLDAREGWSGWYDAFKPVRFGNLSSEIIETEAFKSVSGGKAVIIVHSKLAEKNSGGEYHVKTAYTISGDGIIEVKVDFRMSKSCGFIPRVGAELVIPGGFENLSYFGYGENENYPDRMLSAKLGVFSSTIDRQHFPFIPPSENGGHEGTRWLSLTNNQGNTLKISACKPFHFDIHHHTVEDYQNAAHERELVKRSEGYLHIDAAHFPIGSEMAWSTRASEHHQIKTGNYSLDFTMFLG